MHELGFKSIWFEALFFAIYLVYTKVNIKKVGENYVCR